MVKFYINNKQYKHNFGEFFKFEIAPTYMVQKILLYINFILIIDNETQFINLLYYSLK